MDLQRASSFNRNNSLDESLTMDDLASLSSNVLSDNEDDYRPPKGNQEEEEEDLEEDGMDADDMDVLASGQGGIPETLMEIGPGVNAVGNNPRYASQLHKPLALSMQLEWKWQLRK